MLKPLILLFTGSSLSVAMAASLSIGFVQSTGNFRIDGSTILGNSTLFEGTQVETSLARSVLQLPSAQITLSPESSAKVFHDHTILEKGTSLLKESNSHRIEAKTLRIAPVSRESIIQVEITGPSQVAIASRRGSAEVRNSAGVLVASLRPGAALSLNAQAAATTTVTMSGQVVSRNGNYFLTDTTTNVTVQLEGPDVAKFSGKQVVINGSITSGSQPAGGASQVIHVTSITNLAAGGAAPAAVSGLSALAKGAIIAGVSAAGAVVGLAAAGSFTSTTPVSR